MTYAYTSYSLFDGTPLVRLSHGYPGAETTFAEYKLDWSRWQTPVDVNVGPDLWVAVRPWEIRRQYPGGRPSHGSAGVQGWGRVSAYRVQWGVKDAVDMQHEDVIKGLRSLEEMEALSWLVRAVEGDDA